MARAFVKRDGSANVIGYVRWPHPDFPEELTDDHPDVVAFRDRQSETPRKPKAPPPGATAAQLRQALIDAGFFEE